jgi:hypothetical protein
MDQWPGKLPLQPNTPPRSKLAAVYGLPPDTPDNVVRMYGGALVGNNRAHTIKDAYDANNPPPPVQTTTQSATQTPSNKKKPPVHQSAPTDIGD